MFWEGLPNTISFHWPHDISTSAAQRAATNNWRLLTCPATLFPSRSTVTSTPKRVFRRVDTGLTANEAARGTLNNADGAQSTGATAVNLVQVIGLVAKRGGAGGSGHSTTGPVSGASNTSLYGGN